MRWGKGQEVKAVKMDERWKRGGEAPGPLGGLVLEQLLDEVPRQGADPRGDMVLVLLDSAQKSKIKYLFKVADLV